MWMRWDCAREERSGFLKDPDFRFLLSFLLGFLSFDLFDFFSFSFPSVLVRNGHRFGGVLNGSSDIS